MRMALAALGWPVSLSRDPVSHRHSPGPLLGHDCAGRGLCAGVALRLYKLCGETAARRRMGRAGSGSTPVPGALGLRPSRRLVTAVLLGVCLAVGGGRRVAGESDLGVTIFSSLIVVCPPARSSILTIKGEELRRHRASPPGLEVGRKLDLHQRGCLLWSVPTVRQAPAWPMLEMKGEGLSPPLLFLEEESGKRRNGVEGRRGATGSVWVQGSAGGCQGGGSGCLLSSSLPSAWFHSATWIPLALEASAGTSFHLGCHQWLGQRQEVGMGLESQICPYGPCDTRRWLHSPPEPQSSYLPPGYLRLSPKLSGHIRQRNETPMLAPC